MSRSNIILVVVITVTVAFGIGFAVGHTDHESGEMTSQHDRNDTRVAQLERENDRLRTMLNTSRKTNKQYLRHIEEMSNRTVPKSRVRGLKAQLNTSRNSNNAYRRQIQTRNKQLAFLVELERKSNSTDIDGNGYVNAWELLKGTNPENESDHPTAASS